MPVGRSIRVQGLVQGVGFRPFIWTLARDEALTGSVLNDGAGVLIEAFGSPDRLDRFTRRIVDEKPPLARIDAVDWLPLTGPAPQAFVIARSEGGAVKTGIVPDAATCPACLAELHDPENHRYHYPFINCTHCGPRLSIIERIPYDRAMTSMRVFPLCPACKTEYGDPTDRRFHAQPNACPVCGPQIWLEGLEGFQSKTNVIERAADALNTGQIVAMRGIGGFHLVCDASCETAVALLRTRKQRPAKPLAVMIRDIRSARNYVHLSADDERLLESTAAPIVLARKGEVTLADSIAPGQDMLGVMLPYSPLHHLLMEAVDRPLVMTSGNRSGEPQVIGNDEARVRLGDLCDLFLMHNREIVNRLDDSVVRVGLSGPQLLRRARGFAPEPMVLPDGFDATPRVLAYGGDLKAAFCLLGGRQAVLSQHMGDLDAIEIRDDFRKNLSLYRSLFDFDPECIAADCHDGYVSSRLAYEDIQDIPVHRVQHHHAHFAACLVENGVHPGEEPVLGIILDGTGAGTDGTVWGGEILMGDYGAVRRVAHMLPVALPGGDRASREPWRNGIAHLKAAFGFDWRAACAGAGLPHLTERKEAALLEQMIDRGINAPLSSSAGRLFDACAAILGVCVERQTYEGQCGIELEALAWPHILSEPAYPVALSDQILGNTPVVLSWAPLWSAVLDDLRRGLDRGKIAARFHNGLVEAFAGLSFSLAEQSGCRRVALSGGVMQNGLLSDGLYRRILASGLTPLVHRTIPANDGGLALGQAAIVAVKACS